MSTDTVTDHRSTTLPASLDDLDHVCCCLNDNLSLCGFDVTGAVLDDDLGDIDCVVCADLAHSHICPFTNKPCPEETT